MIKRRIAAMLLAVFTAGLIHTASAESLIVTANLLNGRGRPSKKAAVEARFDKGDTLTPTGAWSKDKKWVEVAGGETGTVWVAIQYVTEITAPYKATNSCGGKVYIRKLPGGTRTIGTIKPEEKITIDRQILGWGHCKRGWVDLRFFEEE